ncbi:hypothetical protein MW887_004147 [Aspergillus wentii]|nr:hypothetical protein MW887_004147 [Aspergillus wentii]
MRERNRQQVTRRNTSQKRQIHTEDKNKVQSQRPLQENGRVKLPRSNLSLFQGDGRVTNPQLNLSLNQLETNGLALLEYRKHLEYLEDAAVNLRRKNLRDNGRVMMVSIPGFRD